jgi:hypothetical protein
MSPAIFNTTRKHSLVKRQNNILRFLKINLGGKENNPEISGSHNKVIMDGSKDKDEEATLLLKAGHQVSRIMDGTTDVIVAPAKYFLHISSI